MIKCMSDETDELQMLGMIDAVHFEFVEKQEKKKKLFCLKKNCCCICVVKCPSTHLKVSISNNKFVSLFVCQMFNLCHCLEHCAHLCFLLTKEKKRFMCIECVAQHCAMLSLKIKQTAPERQQQLFLTFELFDGIATTKEWSHVATNCHGIAMKMTTVWSHAKPMRVATNCLKQRTNSFDKNNTNDNNNVNNCSNKPLLEIALKF